MSRSGPARSAPAERYWRWARRNPVIAVLGGVLTALAGRGDGGLAGSGVLLQGLARRR